QRLPGRPVRPSGPGCAHTGARRGRRVGATAGTARRGGGVPRVRRGGVGKPAGVLELREPAVKWLPAWLVLGAGFVIGVVSVIGVIVLPIVIVLIVLLSRVRSARP